jgi:Ca2+-binding EF-hand superfamily protein
MRLRVMTFSLVTIFTMLAVSVGDEPTAQNGARPASQNSSKPDVGRGLNARMRAEILKRFDANSNGKLDPDEMAKAREEFQKRMVGREGMMKRFDSDGDGMLDDQERRDMRRMMASAGALTAGERKPRLDQSALLEKFDADKDGALDPQERLAAIKEIRKRRSE